MSCLKDLSKIVDDHGSEKSHEFKCYWRKHYLATEMQCQDFCKREDIKTDMSREH